MQTLFGKINSGNGIFTIFQDEAGDTDRSLGSNYFYHGFLFVDNKAGRSLLDKLISVKARYKKRDTEISFKKIRGIDYRAKIALEWLDYAKEWLKRGDIRFFVIGINCDKLKNFWTNGQKFEKNVYLRFFEIGLRGSVKWFENDKKRPVRQISHVYYEYGNYNDGRKNKIKWLGTNFGGIKSALLYSDERTQSRVDRKNAEYSNFIQLTDLLLGVCRYSFVKINQKHTGRIRCVDSFVDVVENFVDSARAYNVHHELWKKYSVSFFPKGYNLTKSEFLSGKINYGKLGSFYCDRKTHRQNAALAHNGKLF